MQTDEDATGRARRANMTSMHGLGPVNAVAVAVVLVTLAWCPPASANSTPTPPSTATASNKTSADGFSGWEKKVTDVDGSGEPEIAVGPSGTPLLVAFNGCGIAVSHDRGAYSVSGTRPSMPG
jgi:hypothetical protein